MSICPTCGRGGEPRGLTPQQRKLHDFITDYTGKHGISPSYDEMVKAMGLASKSNVHRLVVGLEERGHIVRLPHRKRSIMVLDRLGPVREAAE